MGSPTDYQAFCSRLALRLDAAVIIPDYRLAPEHPFPAGVDDCLAAYGELLDAGRPTSSIALVGDSAGGGLVLSRLLAARRAELPQPAVAVGISTWADLTLDADAYQRCSISNPFITRAMLHRAAEHYLAGTDPRHPLASPVHAQPQELTGLAPILVQGAANEVLAVQTRTLSEPIVVAPHDGGATEPIRVGFLSDMPVGGQLTGYLDPILLGLAAATPSLWAAVPSS